MNSSQISAFIENPALISAGDVDALKQLANEHSYSEAFQFLYLYAVSKYNDIRFDEALLATAYKITNRERILQLLDSSDSVVIEPLISSVTEDIEETPIIELKEVVTEETTLQVEDENEEDVEIEFEQNIEEPKDELEELIYNTTATALEQDYFSKQPVEEADTSTDSTSKVEKIEETIEEPISESEIFEEKPVQETLSEDSKMSFTSWLKQNHQTEEKQSQEVTPEKKHKEEIIDRFIETQPSISKPTAEFYSASKKAKESLDESRTPVSETLAKIYVAQGNYQKAIHVYHQLILINPEKKSLFAPRIEELKNKLTL